MTTVVGPVSGRKGAVGEAGSVGPKGDTGLTGPKGDTGDTGPKGDIGATGAKGDQGIQGVPGTAAKLVQSTVVTTNAAGLYTWTFPTAFAAAPRVVAGVQAAADIFDVKVTAVSATQCTVQIGRTQAAVVALLGLTILSVPASVGAQTVHIIAVAP